MPPEDTTSTYIHVVNEALAGGQRIARCHLIEDLKHLALIVTDERYRECLIWLSKRYESGADYDDRSDWEFDVLENRVDVPFEEWTDE